MKGYWKNIKSAEIALWRNWKADGSKIISCCRDVLLMWANKALVSRPVCCFTLFRSAVQVLKNIQNVSFCPDTYRCCQIKTWHLRVNHGLISRDMNVLFKGFHETLEICQGKCTFARLVFTWQQQYVFGGIRVGAGTYSKKQKTKHLTPRQSKNMLQWRWQESNKSKLASLCFFFFSCRPCRRSSVFE